MNFVRSIINLILLTALLFLGGFHLYAFSLATPTVLNTQLKTAGTLNTTSHQSKPGYQSPAEGVYLIQFRTEDASANTSGFTTQYLLEYDITKPQFFNINNASSPNRQTLVDWKQNGEQTNYNDGRGNLPPVTNQTNLTLNSTTEQLADVEYFLINNQGQNDTNQTKTFVNARDQKHTVSFNLGNLTADQHGQEGLAQDGYYQICYNSSDSANNEKGMECFAVERDTLTPQTPNLNVNLNFQYKNEPYYISGNIQGEPYTTSNLFANLGRNGQKGGTLKTLDINNDNDWENTFTFCSNLSDRATNTSPSVCRSVRTPVRPPRAGECSISDTAIGQIRDSIEAGVDADGNSLKPLDPGSLGFSRSCGVYEPDLIQKQIQDEANKVIAELEEKYNREVAEQQKKNQELTEGATCLTGKLEQYQKNKGSSNASESEFNNWVNECGVTSDIKNIPVDIKDENGNSLTLEQAFKNSIDGVKEQNKRGTMEGCKWDTWPWASNSCVSNGVGEAVHWVSEGVGNVSAFLISPITATAQLGWDSLTTGNWNNLGDRWTQTHSEHYDIIQNNVSSVTSNTIHGFGRLVQAVPGLIVNGLNAVGALVQGAGDCVFGKECSWENVNKNYDKNTQAWQDTIGWNGGDWLDNVNVAAGAAVGFLGAFAGGPWGAVLASNLFDYALRSGQNGGQPIGLNEFLCEGKEGFDCNVNIAANLLVSYGIGKILDGAAGKFRKTPKPGIELDSPSKKPGVKTSPKTKLDIDDLGNPCFRTQVSSLTPVDYLFAFFRPISVSACPSGGGKSINQMQQEINKGKAPNGITQAHSPKIPNEKPHVHFDGNENIALNIDGTWKHKPPEGFTLTSKQKSWLKENGFTLPE